MNYYKQISELLQKINTYSYYEQANFSKMCQLFNNMKETKINISRNFQPTGSSPR